MEIMFKGTGITELDLDQDHQASVKNQMVTFDEADFHKS